MLESTFLLDPFTLYIHSILRFATAPSDHQSGLHQTRITHTHFVCQPGDHALCVEYHVAVDGGSMINASLSAPALNCIFLLR